MQILLLLVISYPLGKHIAKVYKEGNDCMRFMAPIERFIYKLAGINPNEEMDWKAFLKSLLIINVFWFFWGMILLVSQGYLPLNPDGNSGQSPDLAFNTCISFMVNCNLQHYSGESGLTYFTQLFVIMLFQFITAATGMAAMAGIMKSMAAKTTKTIGNFWHYLVISCTRILFPMSLIVGFILIIQGTPMGFDSKMTIPTLEGAEQTVSQGPTAAIVPIKQLGTNGGGYFGVNSSHPLENPTYLTNIVECWSILIIPMALVFALGFYLKRKKLGYVIYGVMLFAYLLGVFCNVHYEMAGNPKIDEMGIDQSCGAMEGKETRLGPGATALWSVTTTVTSNGSVNGMHDSTMPLSGMVEMLNMQINTWFGGVGVGFMNYYAFLIIAVFISGLMVGRTPEFLGKKVEAREMKIATIVSLAHPFVILIFTAISSYVWVYAPEFVESEGGWLNNPGFHGFSEMLYEYTSSSANNGSGFEGLNKNIAYYAKRGSDPKNKVTTDEYAIGITYIDGTIESLLDEYDVSIVYPADGIPWVPEGVAAFKNAENTDAAKYFIEWLFSSDENLRMLAEIDQKNSVKTIKPSLEGLDLGYDAGMLMKEDLSLFGEKRTEILEHFEALMGDKAADE